MFFFYVDHTSKEIIITQEIILFPTSRIPYTAPYLYRGGRTVFTELSSSLQPGTYSSLDHHRSSRTTRQEHSCCPLDSSHAIQETQEACSFYPGSRPTLKRSYFVRWSYYMKNPCNFLQSGIKMEDRNWQILFNFIMFDIQGCKKFQI